MNIIEWVAIIISIIFQVFLFSIGMNFNKKIIKFSAITVYMGMMIFFFSVLLNDVKFSSNAFINILDFENFLDKNNIRPLLSVYRNNFCLFLNNDFIVWRFFSVC